MCKNFFPYDSLPCAWLHLACICLTFCIHIVHAIVNKEIIDCTDHLCYDMENYVGQCSSDALVICCFLYLWRNIHYLQCYLHQINFCWIILHAHQTTHRSCSLMNSSLFVVKLALIDAIFVACCVIVHITDHCFNGNYFCDNMCFVLILNTCFKSINRNLAWYWIFQLLFRK